MSTSFGKPVSIAALAIGPLSLIVGNIAQWLLQPTGDNPTATDVASQFPASWLAIGLLGVFGQLIWLAGIPAAVDLTPGKGRLVTLTGGLLTGAGLAAGIGHIALYFGFYNALAQAGLSPDALADLDAAVGQETLGNVLLMVFLACYSVGPMVLTIGLRVGRVVPVWVPIAAIVTAGANLFGGPIAGVVQLVTLVLLWAPLVLAVARQESDPSTGSGTADA